jgi:hypothetical protein
MRLTRQRPPKTQQVVNDVVSIPARERPAECGASGNGNIVRGRPPHFFAFAASICAAVQGGTMPSIRA